MSTLTSKLQEITQRLQHLTLWRPNERDPFVELDRWRTDSFVIIEQIYSKKKQQIEQLMDKHEREFMRQLTRQRTLLNRIRQRIVPQKDTNTLPTIQNESSILSDLQKIDNDINTKLGRAEIQVQVNLLNPEDSVAISLKTYLSATPSVCVKEMMIPNEHQKPTPRSADQVAQAYVSWLHVKRVNDVAAREALLSAQQRERDKEQVRRTEKAAKSKQAFENWASQKDAAAAAAKMIKSRTVADDVRIETTGT